MKHGGDRTALAREALCEPEEILDFSVNLNPLGAPGCVAEAYYRAFDKLNEYPSPYAEKLSARLAQKLGMKTERIRQRFEPASRAHSVCAETETRADRRPLLSRIPDRLRTRGRSGRDVPSE